MTFQVEGNKELLGLYQGPPLKCRHPQVFLRVRVAFTAVAIPGSFPS